MKAAQIERPRGMDPSTKVSRLDGTIFGCTIQTVAEVPITDNAATERSTGTKITLVRHENELTEKAATVLLQICWWLALRAWRLWRDVFVVVDRRRR